MVTRLAVPAALAAAALALMPVAGCDFTPPDVIASADGGGQNPGADGGGGTPGPYPPSNFNDWSAVTPVGGIMLNCGISTFDSEAGTFDNWCGQPEPAVVELGGAAVLAMDSLTIGMNHTLLLEGDIPVILAVFSDATIAGTIDAGGKGEVPGPGADAGCTAASGTRADDSSEGGGGAGGGGFGQGGGSGGDGGNDGPGAGGGGGSIGSDRLIPLRGGCGGGQGGAHPDSGQPGGLGGGGGGAVQVSAQQILTVTGTITAGGGGGQEGSLRDGGGGAGSGGGILLEATTLTIGAAGVTAALTANGGGGGEGGRVSGNNSDPGDDGQPRSANRAIGGGTSNGGDGGDGGARMNGAGAGTGGATVGGLLGTDDGVGTLGGEGTGGGGGGGGVGRIRLQSHGTCTFINNPVISPPASGNGTGDCP